MGAVFGGIRPWGYEGPGWQVRSGRDLEWEEWPVVQAVGNGPVAFSQSFYCKNIALDWVVSPCTYICWLEKNILNVRTYVYICWKESVTVVSKPGNWIRNVQIRCIFPMSPWWHASVAGCLWGAWYEDEHLAIRFGESLPCVSINHPS